MTGCDACSRRTFVGRAGALIGAAAGLPVVAGCGDGPGSVGPPSGLPGGVEVTSTEVRLRLDDVAPLAVAGGSLLVAAARVLVTRPGAEEYLAFDAACPHAGSLVANRDGALLVCPTHGSAFDLRGALRRGPAESSLRALPLTRQPARTLVVARP